ncbi:MAG: hypothetical protein JNL74_10205, partial [Fibrobacteres bacterium]|nr:hypothetical protein [Fibrobacterota bacterium]
IVLFNSIPLCGFEEQAFTSDVLLALRLGFRYKIGKMQYVKFTMNTGSFWKVEDVSAVTDLKKAIIDQAYNGISLEYSASIPRVGPLSLSVSLPVLSKDEKVSNPASPIFYLSAGHDF